MDKAATTPRLTAIALERAGVEAVYRAAGSEERVHRPGSIRVSPHSMFIEWRDAPDDLRGLQVVWSENPFMPRPFRCDCTVLERQPEGLLIEFEGPVPGALKEWFHKAGSLLEQRVPDAAVKTSRLYTSATVVSAGGLFCGALAILLPILAGDRVWVDLVSKLLLVVMVCSIAGFAWLRALAGKAEVKAIAQGQA